MPIKFFNEYICNEIDILYLWNEIEKTSNHSGAEFGVHNKSASLVLGERTQKFFERIES